MLCPHEVYFLAGVMGNEQMDRSAVKEINRNKIKYQGKRWTEKASLRRGPLSWGLEEKVLQRAEENYRQRRAVQEPKEERAWHIQETVGKGGLKGSVTGFEDSERRWVREAGSRLRARVRTSGFILREGGSREEGGKEAIFANFSCEALKVSILDSSGHKISVATIQLCESSNQQHVNKWAWLYSHKTTYGQ